jgi:hypothetical protein
LPYNAQSYVALCFESVSDDLLKRPAQRKEPVTVAAVLANALLLQCTPTKLFLPRVQREFKGALDAARLFVNAIV